MNKKGMERGGIISIVIFAILGVVLLGVVYNMVIDRVTTYTGTQNNINYTTADTNYLLTSPHADFQEVTGTNSIINNSGVSLVTTCNISVSRNLMCSVVHNTTTASLINVSYSWVKGGYYTNTTTRTISPIIAILIAMGILYFIAVSSGFGEKKK
jgi:hypothetical protein